MTQYITKPYIYLLCVIALAVPITVFSGLAIVPLIVIFTVPAIILEYKYISQQLCHFYNDGLFIIVVVLFLLSGASIFLNSNTDNSTIASMYFRFLGMSIISYIFYVLALKYQLTVNDRILFYLSISVVIALFVIGITGYLLKILLYINDTRSAILYSFLLHLDRSATISSLLIWPMIAGYLNNKKYKVSLAIYLYALVCLLPCLSLSAKVSIVLGGCVFALAALFPLVSYWMAGISIVSFLSLCPWLGRRLPEPSAISDLHMSSSLLHRLEIWKYVSNRIFEAPVLGHGWGSSRVIAKNEHFTLVDSFGNATIQEYLPLHPHNAPLQVWLELGGIGVFLVVIVLLMILFRSRPSCFSSRLSWPCNAGAIASAVIVASVSYGFWQEWWQATLWLLATLMAVQNRSKFSPKMR